MTYVQKEYNPFRIFGHETERDRYSSYIAVLSIKDVIACPENVHLPPFL